MIQTSNRLNKVTEYYFSKKLREVRNLQSQGKEIINLGIGSPDIQPPKEVIDGLKESLNRPNAHQYQSYQGTPALRESIAYFYQKNFNVELNPESQILPLMGSKEGIMHISMAYLNSGDHVLIPNPGYPTYASVTELVGAKAVYYNLSDETNWLPNFKEIEKNDLSKVKIMWINYPHMPSGAKASVANLKAIVDFGLKHNILIINDNPYSFILNEAPVSLLSIKNSKKHCLELNSLSKTFSMAGWRVGMVCGHESLIKPILTVKSNMDSGMFLGIQYGAIAALRTSNKWYEDLNKTYRKRQQKVMQLAELLGCTIENKKQSGLFVWVKTPKKGDDYKFVDYLIDEFGIFIAPGSIFGSNGSKYVRFSICSDVKQIERAIQLVSQSEIEV